MNIVSNIRCYPLNPPVDSIDSPWMMFVHAKKSTTIVKKRKKILKQYNSVILLNKNRRIDSSKRQKF